MVVPVDGYVSYDPWLDWLIDPSVPSAQPVTPPVLPSITTRGVTDPTFWNPPEDLPWQALSPTYQEPLTPAGEPAAWHEPIVPTSAPWGAPPEGKRWSVQYYTSALGTEVWDWVLVDIDTPSRPAVSGAPAPWTQPPGGPEGTVSELLGPLAWWKAEALPPLLRNWGQWLRELVEINATTSPIVNPFEFDEAAEVAIDEPISPTLPKMRTARQTITEVQQLLGVQFAEGATPTEKWQEFLNKLPTASLQAQQLLASMRYDAKRGWYTVDTPQLVHPAYT